MANPSHLKKLKEGAKAWNKWRRENKNIIPDLSNADLTAIHSFVIPEYSDQPIYADLSSFNFSKTRLKNAKLAGVKLSGVNLSLADLRDADLYEADLRKANLKEANLQRSTLSYARLEEANLTKANLTQANLSEARLKKAKLKNATLIEIEADLVRLSYADLSGANLTKAKMMDANCHGANFKKATLVKVDLLGATLVESNFSGADLTNADLSQTALSKSNFEKANLSYSKFSHAGLNLASLKNVTAINANFFNVYLGKTNLANGNWEGTNFFAANFSEANLTNCNFSHTNLNRTIFVKTNMSKITIQHASVYGVSVWDVIGKIKNQNDLVITPKELPAITVDELEMAQFIYLLVNNTKIRNAIDTITSKAVLILGRFYKERKEVLDALRDELRKRNYVPIVFDFEKPSSKDLTETVATLAQMSRFIIADITDAKSIPQELSYIIPNNPSLPVATIMAKKYSAYSMYEHFERYPWVLPIYKYTSKNQLLKVLKEKVINPAEQKANELRPK